MTNWHPIGNWPVDIAQKTWNQSQKDVYIMQNEFYLTRNSLQTYPAVKNKLLTCSLYMISAAIYVRQSQDNGPNFGDKTLGFWPRKRIGLCCFVYPIARFPDTTRCGFPINQSQINTQNTTLFVIGTYIPNHKLFHINMNMLKYMILCKWINIILN